FSQRSALALRLHPLSLHDALPISLTGGWSLSAFGFVDELRFSGSDERPLDTAVTKTPLALPAEALFTDLHGTYRNTGAGLAFDRSEEHTSELQSHLNLVCRLLLEK